MQNLPFRQPGRFFMVNLHTHSTRSDGALEPEALLAVLKAGHYYSSQGPEIHDIAIENGDAIIRCSPCSVVMLTSATYHVVRERGENLTEVQLPLSQFRHSYARLTVIDAAGKRVWSNPFWLD